MLRHSQRSLAATGTSFARGLGTLGDGKVQNLGALGAPKKDGSSTESNKAIEVFTAGKTTSSALEEFRLETVVTVLVLLAIKVPATDGVLEILQ